MIQYIKYDTIKYDTIKYDTIKYDTIKYDTMKYDTMKYDTILYKNYDIDILQILHFFTLFLTERRSTGVVGVS